jgi:hypothetical protein
MRSGSDSAKNFTFIALLVVLLAVVSSPALGQSDSNPKWDLFGGYQWLHPGGTVPAPIFNPNAPVAYKLPDMSKGFGAALTYNFSPHVGGEFDAGRNWGNINSETTFSVGPRFIWRTDSGNYFLHSLVSLNRVEVNGLNSGNGIGAILGGGMDLPIIKGIGWRVFEADYVYGRHNYAKDAALQFPELRRRPLGCAGGYHYGAAC